MTTLTSESLKRVAIERGADLVGIAPIERFKNAPEMYHPRRFLPEVKSVIIVGNRVLRGLTYGLKNNIAYLPYDIFGHGWLSNVKINMSAVDLSRYIEDCGYHAVPLPWPCTEGRIEYLSEKKPPYPPPYNRSGTIMKEGWPGESYISFKHAAVAAGLGVLGWNRLLLTPEFGPRQRLDAIITDAPFAPDPLMDPNSLCDPKDCGFRCVEACPAKILNKDAFISVQIDDNLYKYAVFDEIKCAWVLAGLCKETCKFVPQDSPVPDGRITADDFSAKKKEIQSQVPVYRRFKTFAFTASTFCSRCLIACSEYLEEKKKVKNLFHTKM